MKIGFCNGCFDLFHDGHRLFLAEAKRLCDYLIVAVNNDASVRMRKGPGRPAHKLENRVANVWAFLNESTGTPFWYAVIPFDGNDRPLIRSLAPDVIIKS